MPAGSWAPPDSGNAPEEVKRILRTVYAAYRDEHPAEDPDVKAKGAQIAWGAVKRAGWTKDKDENWVKEKPVGNLASNLISIDNEGSFTQPHDITLNRLDTHLPYGGVPSGKLKYLVDNFSGTEEAWNNTLAVFVPPGVPIQHVDHAAFARDPQGEVKRLGFRIAGHHANTRVISTGPGEPRLTTEAVFDLDPEADQFAREGKLSPSSGFDVNIVPEGYMTGKVTPNHVLYFLRNEKTAFSTPATPNDLGAMVNNLAEQEIKDMDEQEKGMLAKVHDILDGTSKKEIADLKAQIANLEVQNVDKQGAIDALKAEISNMKKMLAEKETKLAEMDNLAVEQAQKKKDEQWTAIKNLYKPGIFHKPEDEKALRESHEKDPVTFQLANVGNLQTGTVKKAEGVTAVGNVDDPGKPVDVAAIRGDYDPINHVFKGMI